MTSALPAATRRLACDLTSAGRGRDAASRLGDRIGSRLLRASSLPIDVYSFAASEQIEIVHIESMTESGRVEWTDRGLRVALSAKEPVSRKRFTLAHELAHCLIFGKDTVGQRVESKEEEIRCDRFASSLLMPNAVFSEEFNRRRQSSLTEVVRDLAGQFGVSLNALLVRLNELQLMPIGSILLLVEFGAVTRGKVRLAAYDRTGYRELAGVTLDELAIGEVVREVMSRSPDQRREYVTPRLFTKQRRVPRHLPSHIPSILVCTPSVDSRNRALIELQLFSDPLRPRGLNMPTDLQQALPRLR